MSRPARQILAVEMLIPEDARRERVTVADHSAFRKSITPTAPDPFDEIDELAAEPILDRLPQRRASRGAGRIFKILDELETGTAAR